MGPRPNLPPPPGNQHTPEVGEIVPGEGRRGGGVRGKGGQDPGALILTGSNLNATICIRGEKWITIPRHTEGRMGGRRDG